MEELKEKLMYYYEVDLDNCEMTHEMWINELAKSMYLKGYKESFLKDYEEYQKLRLE